MLLDERLDQIAEMLATVLRDPRHGRQHSAERLQSFREKTLPVALSDFHARYATNPIIMSTYLAFTPLDQFLSSEDQFRTICKDLQGAFQWSLCGEESDLDDPRVYQRSNSRMQWTYYFHCNRFS